MTSTQTHRTQAQPVAEKRDAAPTSRLPGLHRKPVAERRALCTEHVDEALRFPLETGATLPLEVADRMSENVIAIQGLPLSVATNFRVAGRDVLVPMSVEEPSVVAAASNAARMVRLGGGFEGEADAAIMTAQVQLD